MDIDDPFSPLHRFYEPFFTTCEGQIFVLSAEKAHIRDGLAALLIVRLFPAGRFEGITIEPSRPSVAVEQNVILVGRASLFLEKELGNAEVPCALPVGYAGLGERLAGIMGGCCYAFEGNGDRILRNTLTGEDFPPTEKDTFGKEVDYGVIRRVFRGASQNTILLEGVHSLGTLGAAKVATSPAFVKEIWDTLDTIPSYDPSLPIEVLVRASFDPAATQGVRTQNNVELRVVNIVYNRNWIYESETHAWKDQEPYDLVLEIRGDPPRARPLRAAPSADVPVLEIEADLRQLPAATRALCREVARRIRPGARPDTAAGKGSFDRFLAELTASSDLFRVSLRGKGRFGGPKTYPLPINPREIRLERKRFLVHLVLALLAGRGFTCREREIRRYFPKLAAMKERDGQTLAERFTARISGRMRDGFLPLLGERRAPTQYIEIHYDRREKVYRLRLMTLTVVLKFRF